MPALIPHPWPTVSAVHATVTSRGAVRAAGVVNDPAIGSLQTKILKTLKTRAVENALPRSQPGEIDARGEVSRLERRWSDDASGVREGLRRCVFDDEACRPIGAAPDNRAIAINVPGGGAKGGRGACRV